MELLDKIVVVTGAAHGIGKALATRFAAEGARTIVIADIDREAAEQVARSLEGAESAACNVASEAEVAAFVDSTLKRHGRIDLFCNNAGIAIDGGCDVPNHDWHRIWEVNLMSHVYATRAVLPSMLARGDGYLLNTVSAAGLLTSLGSAPYAVTKHAALAFAEWVSITHGDRGIKVSALCPQGVWTNMLEGADSNTLKLLRQTAISPEQVADAAVAGLRAERFLILPHPEVAEFFRRKAADYDRWIAGMRRLQASLNSIQSEAESEAKS